MNRTRRNVLAAGVLACPAVAGRLARGHAPDLAARTQLLADVERAAAITTTPSELTSRACPP